ncbi:MAG: GTPase Era [Actinomycetota bacterium]
MTHFETRSGFVSVVGRPNVGKSTLVNALVGQKVAITSARPQTTRNTIRGVLTIPADDAQIVLVDTPGIHKPRTTLGERLNTLVYGSLSDADAALFVVDATKPIGPGDRLIAERLKESEVPVVLALNKIDVVSRETIMEQLTTASPWEFDAYVPISARSRDGIDAVVSELVSLLPPGPFFFPPDARSDQPDSFLAGEIIREKYLARLREELPHSLAVVVDNLEMDDKGILRIAATAVVERESQKGMAIGKGGSMIKAVGTDARQDLERLFGTKVFLEIRVKVEKDWQRSDDLLDRLGF